MKYHQTKRCILLIICLVFMFSFAAQAEARPTEPIISEVTVLPELTPAAEPLPAAEETAASEVQLTSIPENEPTADAVVTQTPQPDGTPAAAPSPSPAAKPEESSAPMQTASPAPSAAPDHEDDPFFADGYVKAGAETPIYKTRNSSEDNLLLLLPRSACLYTTHRYGDGDRLDWVRVLIYSDFNGVKAVYEGYTFADYLEPVPAEELTKTEAELRSGSFVEAEGGVLRLIRHRESSAPAEEPYESSASEGANEAALTEEPANETGEESISPVPSSEPSPEPTVEAPTSTPLSAASPSVSILIHAKTPVRIGDTVTLEAVTEGYDHEPVFLWEYRLPGDDRWYPCEGETGRTMTFIVNHYNSQCSWRVTAN